MNETVSTEREVNVSGGFYAGVLGMDPQLNCLDIIKTINCTQNMKFD